MRRRGLAVQRSLQKAASERQPSLSGSSPCCRAARLPSPLPAKPLFLLSKNAPSAVPPPLALLSSRDNDIPRCPSHPLACDAGNDPPRPLPLPPLPVFAPLFC